VCGDVIAAASVRESIGYRLFVENTELFLEQEPRIQFCAWADAQRYDGR
jgi:hypothetical protein